MQSRRYSSLHVKHTCGVHSVIARLIHTQRMWTQRLRSKRCLINLPCILPLCKYILRLGGTVSKLPIMVYSNVMWLSISSVCLLISHCLKTMRFPPNTQVHSHWARPWSDLVLGPAEGTVTGIHGPIVRSSSVWINHYRNSVWMATPFLPWKNLYDYKNTASNYILEWWTDMKWEMNKFTYQLTRSHVITFPDSRPRFGCKATVHWLIQKVGCHWMIVSPHHRALIGRRYGCVDAQPLCGAREPLPCSQKNLHIIMTKLFYKYTTLKHILSILNG